MRFFGMRSSTIFEAGIFFEKCERHIVHRPIALFGNDEFCLARLLLAGFFVFFVNLGAEEHADNIRILLDGSGFTQVRQHGASAFFIGLPVELGEHDNRDIQLLRECLETIGNLGHFNLPIFLRTLRGGAQKLQVIHHNHLDAQTVAHASGFRTQLENAETGGIIDENFGFCELGSGR